MTITRFIPVFPVLWLLANPVIRPVDKVVVRITHQQILDCETGNAACAPITVTRGTLRDSVKLVFPSGGTSTAVFIYTEATYKQMIRDNKYATGYVAKNNGRNADGSVNTDLTALPDGKYVASMLSCNLGGFFGVNLVTKH